MCFVGRLLLAAVFSLCLATAAEIRGTVVDPSGAAVPNAQVWAVNRVGIVAQTGTSSSGAFELRVPDSAPVRVFVTAAGFETRTVTATPGDALEVRISIAPQVDSIRVAGSTIDVPPSEQGSSVSVIPGEEIRQRNEPFAADLLRYLPGMVVSEAGPRGAATGLFIRGGDYNFGLVQIDGVTVNAFGGAFDFAHIPTEFIDRIEVARGPQSAIYGPYANTGAVNIVTRGSTEEPSFEVIAEGGTWQERRFAAGGAGAYRGFGLSAWASRLDSDGPVANSDYHNEHVALGLSRTFTRQDFSLRGNFDSNDTGAPGPYGSNPVGLFTGLDLISRNKNNFSNYLLHYQADVSPRVRQEVFGSFFLNNNFFGSPYDDSWNKDFRGQAESRTLVSVTSSYTTSFGFAWTREEETNTWITDNSYRTFPLRRDQEGIYWENRFALAQRFFLNAGVRAEVINTAQMPANTANGRPALAAQTTTKLNPKVAAAYAWRSTTRLHASFGTGIRPPGGFDLAFTNNPALRPERTLSVDAGVEQRLAGNRLALEATYFYNRFSDLIVTLGGSLAMLSSYRSDNLANSRAQGAEFALRLHPARNWSLTANYTYLKSEILSLDGSRYLAPAYFRVGQELLRRPKHSGSAVGTYTRGRLSANLTGYYRGPVLDVEPNWGASAGLFRNPGYFDMGVNLNYRVTAGLTAYGNLRNALNRRCEEVYGYPAPPLNFLAGMRFTFARKK